MKNAEEQTKKLKATNPLNEVNATSSLDSLSTEALQKFLTRSGRSAAPHSEEFHRELKEMGLLEFSKEKNAYLPSGNAILLFGDRPKNLFPQAAVKAKVDYGNGETGAETFNDAIVLIPDQIDDWVRKVLPASIDRSKFRAEQVPNFPVGVIREAVINAIVHRDYSLDGAKVLLEIRPDRIIIKSPGAPTAPVTIESLKNFTATSWSRNKKISFIFNEMHYMEESAIGMDTFRSLREQYQLPLPVIGFDGTNVVVTFPRTMDALKNVVGNASIEQLNETELRGYDFVKSRKEVSKSEYAEFLGVSDRVALHQLKKMRDLALLTDNGESPNSPKFRYVFKED